MIAGKLLKLKWDNGVCVRVCACVRACVYARARVIWASIVDGCTCVGICILSSLSLSTVRIWLTVLCVVALAYPEEGALTAILWCV